MKKIVSRIAGFLLAGLMLFPLCTYGYTDVTAGSSLDEAVDLLSFLEITKGYEDGSFQPDKTISRAESVSMIARFLNMTYAVSQSSFSDVAVDHYAHNDIELAVSLGIVHGDGDGTFRPDADVTGNEFLKMTVAALGYGQMAELRGGYPSGYLVVAGSIRLLGGLELTGNEPLSRGGAARLLYNALDTAVLTQNGFSSTSSTYTSDSENTALTQYHKLYKVSGILNANETADADGNGAAPRGSVRIGNDIYRLRGTQSSMDDLGCYINAYIDVSDNADNEVVHLYRTEGRSEFLVIQSEDILGYDSNRLDYTDPDTEDNTSISLSPRLNVIYNGKSVSDYTEEMITFRYQDAPEFRTYGSIRLVDSDRNAVYDTAVITAYEDYFVTGINADRLVVYDDRRGVNGEQVNFDVKNPEENVKIYSNKTGAEITFEEIQKEYVLSVAQSADGEKITAYLCDGLVEGMVESMDDQGYLTIDGAEYEIAGGYLKQDGVNSKYTQIKAGTTGSFYLNKAGDICAVDASFMGEYAYLMGIDTISRQPRIRWLSDQNGLQTADLADRVTLRVENDDESTAVSDQRIINEELSYEDIPDVFRSYLYDENGEFRGQLAKVKTNSEKQVNSITILNPAYGPKSAKLADALQYVIEGENYGISFGGMFFDIKKVNGEYDIENSTVKPATSLTRNTTMNLSLYDVSDLDVARIAVVMTELSDSSASEDSDVISPDRPILVVTRVSTSVNEDGEETCRIYGYTNGKPVEALLTESVDTSDRMADSHYSDNAGLTDADGNKLPALTASKLTVGDMIQYTTNAAGEIDRFRTLYRYYDDRYGVDFGNYRTKGKIMYYPDGNTANGMDITKRRVTTPDGVDPTTQSVNTYHTYYSGEIANIDSAAFKVSPFEDFRGQSRPDGSVYTDEDIEKWQKLYIIPEDIKVYKVRLGKQDVQEIMYSDVQRGDYAVVHANWQKVREIYVIEE